LKKLFPILSLIPILFSAGALEAQTVTVDKPTLSFSTQSGGATQSQDLAIGNAGSTVFVAYTDVTWLKVKAQGDPGGGSISFQANTPAVITVIADPAGLAAGGPYTGTVRVNGTAGGGAIEVKVSMTVSSVGATPSPITFAYQLNGIIPAPVQLNLTAAQQIGYSATVNTSTGGKWLSVGGGTTATGIAPGSLQVALTSAVGPTNTPGTYNGIITITPLSGPATAVPVVLTITVAPTVTVNPASINLNYQLGGATGSTNTPAQLVTLANPGSQDVTFGTATNPNGSWLAVSPSSGTVPANSAVQVTVSYVTATGLGFGNYNGSVTFHVPGAATPQILVPVRLTVSASALLNVPGATLGFTYQIGGAQPATQQVLATSSAVAANSTTGQMFLSISQTTTNNGNWLSVPPSAQTGTAFPVSVNPAGLATGTYNGTITITGFGASNGPQTIPVTLTVSNDPLVVVSFGGCSTANTGNNGCPLNFPVQIGQNNPTTQTVRVQSSTGAQASFSATVAMGTSAACGTSWLSSGVTAAVIGNDTSFPITVTPGSIVSGTTCTGTVTIAGINPSTGAALPNSPVTIPVSMYVSSNPMLVVSPVALSFNLAPNASLVQPLSVSSTSSTNLGFNVSASSNGIWLSTFPGAGNTVNVTANAAGLAPGTYPGTITLTATATGVLDSPLTVPVTLTVTAATMAATPTSLSFNQTLGAAAPASKTFAVSTTSTDVPFTTIVSMDNGSGWLSATPVNATATSATPATVTVAVDGSKLAPGTYTGKVTASATPPFTNGSPANVTVTLVVAPGTLSATPATLSFAQVQGGQAPPSQSLSIAGTPGVLAYTVATSTANNSGNWLTVDAATGNTPGTVKVSVNSGSLAPGQYTGKVTITSAGATGSPLDVPVTLVVASPQSVAASPTTLNFNWVIGAPAPAVQTVQVTGSGAGVTFTTVATSTGTWLGVSPATGSAPATLNVSVSPTGLAAGTYTGTVAINSPSAVSNPAASITVNLTVSSVPKPVFTAVANAASYVNGPVSPGENIVIFGTGLGPATLTLGHVTGNTFDTTLANTQVFFDNTPAPIVYTRADQTSVMVPYGVAGRATTSIRVVFSGVQSDPITYSVVNTAPGIYAANSAGSGQGAILNQDFSVNTAGSAAAKNSVVAVYMTGEGTTAPASGDGVVAPLDGTGLYKPIQAVAATVGGVPATVEYFGSAPGIIYGVMQVNVRIPGNAPSGANVPIVVTVGGNSTQTGSTAITVAVQ
jgi:uncharacterized protein (TIGR03437 family)